MKTALIFSIILVIVQLSVFAQQESPNSQPQSRKRFIDKVEVFAGPNLSFNHGNKFIENYSDPLIKNRRLPKVGYLFGVGVYHPVKNRLEINARVIWEHKGTKSELNHPLNPVNNDARQIITYEYTYNYFTLALSSRTFIGSKKKFSISFGGYFGTIKSMRGNESYYDTYNIVPPASFSFNGRYWNGFGADGSINTTTFIPGLQSFEKHDFGIIVGLSYRISITDRHSILIQLVDNYGLQNIYNNTNVENLPEKNHTLNIIFGYQFNRLLDSM